MSEMEWLTSASPGAMLQHLHGCDSIRKLRLFACACCRRIWDLLDQEPLRRAIELSEQFTEGQRGKAELRSALEAATAAALATIGRWYGPRFQEIEAATVSRWHPAVATAIAVIGATSTRRFSWVAGYAAHLAERHARGEFRVGVGSDHAVSHCFAESESQADLLRCIFGNPFRPAAFDRAWHSPTLRSISQAAYEERCMP